MQKFRLLAPSQDHKAIGDIFRGVSAADVRQQTGKRDENTGEMLHSTVSSVIIMIGDVDQDDIFLDIGGGLGNVAAQFATQTNARQYVGIEKRPELVRRGGLCLRSRANQFLLLHKVILCHGDVLETPLSSATPFQDASIIFLNDFLFDETAKVSVSQQLFLMLRARVIVSTSCYCPRHRTSCRSSFCDKWKLVDYVWTRNLEVVPDPNLHVQDLSVSSSGNTLVIVLLISLLLTYMLSAVGVAIL